MASASKKIVVSLALALTTLNGLWLIVSVRSGPLYALAFYALAAFLCGRKNDFRAGFIIGLAGLLIHVCELFFHSLEGLTLPEGGLFLANLILPVPLMYFSLKAHRQRKNQAEQSS